MTSRQAPGADRPTVVDAHMHVWDPSRAAYSWLTPETDPALAVLDRDYPLSAAVGALDALGIDAVVLVQSADTVEDTLAMFDQADANPGRVAGVVAWVPLALPDVAARLLDDWSARSVVGVRHLVHTEADPRWLLRPDVDDGLALLAERGLTFDVCAETVELLELVPVLAERHPRLRIVVDHLAKPPIAAGRDGGAGAPWQAWARALRAAARAPSVHVKLSGLNTAAGPGWSADVFQPYVDVALDSFGPDRTLIGSDWPFARLAADSLEQVWSATAATTAGLTPAERARVLGGTAREVYRLDCGAGEP